MAGGSPPFSREGRQSSLELPGQPGAHRGGTHPEALPLPLPAPCSPLSAPCPPSSRCGGAAAPGGGAQRGERGARRLFRKHRRQRPFSAEGGIPEGSLPSHPLQLLACRSDPGTARRAAPCLFAKGSTALSRRGWQRRAGRTALHSPARDGRARGRHSAPGPAT